MRRADGFFSIRSSMSLFLEGRKRFEIFISGSVGGGIEFPLCSFISGRPAESERFELVLSARAFLWEKGFTGQLFFRGSLRYYNIDSIKVIFLKLRTLKRRLGARLKS